MFYLVEWDGWSLDEACWEPAANILTAKAEVRAFEEIAAAMPLRDVFVEASPSGCCFGKLCKFGAETAYVRPRTPGSSGSTPSRQP